MRKPNLVLLSSIAALFMMLTVSSASAETSYPSGYADDRSQIEDLVNRYMLAIDFNDAEALAALFAEDGILQIGKGQLVGRAAIIASTNERTKEEKDKAAKDTSGMHPPAHRHFVSNLVLKVDGDKASGVAYWCHIGNDTPDRKPVYMTYGHYTDEFVRVNGKWFFKFRKFTNEQSEKNYTKTSANPAP